MRTGQRERTICATSAQSGCINYHFISVLIITDHAIVLTKPARGSATLGFFYSFLSHRLAVHRHENKVVLIVIKFCTKINAIHGRQDVNRLPTVTATDFVWWSTIMTRDDEQLLHVV